MGEFAMTLRAYRKSMGWTQAQLAEQWAYSFETISSWERGKRTPSSTEIPRLAALLDLEPKQLTTMLLAEKKPSGFSCSVSTASHCQETVSSPLPHESTPEPFSDGRLLWSLHLGIEHGGLACVITCPLHDGTTQEITLDAVADFEQIQQLYRLIQGHVIARASEQQEAGARERGKVVRFGSVA